jgi:hypothetical protein
MRSILTNRSTLLNAFKKAHKPGPVVLSILLGTIGALLGLAIYHTGHLFSEDLNRFYIKTLTSCDRSSNEACLAYSHNMFELARAASMVMTAMIFVALFVLPVQFAYSKPMESESHKIAQMIFVGCAVLVIILTALVTLMLYGASNFGF